MRWEGYTIYGKFSIHSEAFSKEDPMVLEQQDRFLANTHVFIVRAWIEPSVSQSIKPEYRFLIEHVRSGQKYGLIDINQLPTLILSFFEKDLSEKQGV